MALTIESPITEVGGIGPSKSTLFEKLGIATVRDLLWYVPFRYDDYSLISPISKVQPGETVTVKGTVESFKSFRTKTGKAVQEATIGDDTGKIKAIWFNQPYLQKIIREGLVASLSGEVSWFGSKLVIMGPDFEMMSEFQAQSNKPSLHTGRFVPVYSETAGISSKYLRTKIAQLLEIFKPEIHEYLPEDLLVSHGLMSLEEAICYIHFPTSLEQSVEAKHRLAFEELLQIHLIAISRRAYWQAQQKAPKVNLSDADKKTFIASLPFTLTDDQQKAVSDILKDISQPYSANRLLIGDVGSGKTVVAAAAMYAMYKNGMRAILMAPTEILANQHFATISKFLEPLGLKVALVTGNTKKVEQGIRKKTGDKKVQENLFGKDAIDFDVYVGTHALLSEQITYKNVGLVIIDEQHRFGVDQRQLLRTKSTQKLSPHLVTMTATPIPRTIALTLYGNLDLSIISQMPSGRLKVKTWVVPSEKRDNGYKWIKNQIAETGGQVFIICPLVDTSESMTSVKAVTAEYEHLTKEVFPEFQIGLLHGRMKSEEKNTVLADFAAGKTQILLATPVVEVGIDIPNATIMMIEAADRFGLGQLHQLRGRVGRGAKQSYCLLFSENEDESSITRLKLLEQYSSGPELAEADLAIRGPGDLFGTRQHGSMNLRYANWADMALIEETQIAAKELYNEDQELSNIPILRERVKQGIIDSSSLD